jgi:hypothetical protein
MAGIRKGRYTGIFLGMMACRRSWEGQQGSPAAEGEGGTEGCLGSSLRPKRTEIMVCGRREDT